jgi:hypothetical protein
MRVADILRKFADIVDQADNAQINGDPKPVGQGDDTNRFKQVMDLIADEQQTEYANQPKEEYADMASVTVNAGGGVNGPKHPADIKGEHPSIYPGKVYGAR